ncbi:hypothetical protein PBY51_008968 [Eleginops maclovinus]|uniref:Anoctamin n=2 Tax=Eleginops maclovinus TaxID=56733 RepID=A0AAN7WIZ2_ELEMC|nr:hypothetical protein PBY51_008968 [Eleginops maclovinus]
MQGYIESSLSLFNISDFSNSSVPMRTPYNITTCRYRDFRYPPGHPRQYEYNVYYWHVIAAKLAFIIVMEHIVYLTKFVLSYVIPDVPYAVKEQIKREKYLTQVILHETNLKLVTKRLKPVDDGTVKCGKVNLTREEMELDF